ncbi:Nucleolar protein 10 [Gracilariopsis chorda]|uniref:Nucleolar protein 10 n=1 Tax=Gracilariopsis chorda TaxID=448386 RepID=A0A2V3IU06_9FLOR|nr:Nucleolar protein 10 [Gracilariopsis chorda]|eukprot:PXF45618.1 Nucleolar protein 10 [Gracilariopsis chorda]
MVRRAPGAYDAKVYDVSGRRAVSLQANLSIGARATAAQKRARRKLELQDTNTDLIQDFAFPTVSQRIKVSPDGQYVFASGTYPPQIHVYDTEDLSLKFKRHVNTDIVDFQILESDWRKFALLTADRYVDLHSPFGSHYKTRVPRFGRDLMLHKGTCDLFVCGDGADVWRLNLEQGRFLAPITTVSGETGGNNVCGISPVNSLLAFGGETAILDVWDPRAIGNTQKPAGTLDVSAALREHEPYANGDMQITSLRFDESDGVTLAVGCSTGYTLLFDLRSPRAMLARDQGNGLPVHSIRLHDDAKHCLTADARSVKVWNRRDGMNMVAIEPDADVNHLCVIGSSGVLCTAVETQRVKTYYIPALGTAPKWCAFLDTFTEELEDGKRITDSDALDGADVEEVYENYKFVAHDELEGLGLGHLIGTELLKPYMHGYFVHQKLHRRAVEVSEPFAYERYRKEKAREKVEAERENRIGKSKARRPKKVDVNQKVVESLWSERNGAKAERRISVLEDDRFKAMFTNKDYAVDEDAERFQFLNPAAAARRDSVSKQDDDSDSDEEYLQQFELVDDGHGNEKNAKNGRALTFDDDESDVDDDDDDGVADEDEGVTNDTNANGIRSTKRKRSDSGPKMYEIGTVGEVTGRKAVAELRGVNRGVTKKIREEISLGTRISRLREKEKQNEEKSERRGSRGGRTHRSRKSKR